MLEKQDGYSRVVLKVLPATTVIFHLLAYNEAKVY